MTTISSAMLLIFITTLSLISLSKADTLGFSADLIHRDSTKSPLYDPSLTPLERLRTTLTLSRDRVYRYTSTPTNEKPARGDLTPYGGDYMLKTTAGTPPLTIYAYADTASDLTWLQCKPCEQCFHQTTPIFDPKSSSTYKKFSCKSSTCKSLRKHDCTKKGDCEYHVTYAGGAYTIGILSSETFTLSSSTGRAVSLPGIIFGCGRKNYGLSGKVSGIVGLGGGSESLVSQIKPYINGKFSYCLLPLFISQRDNKTSQIHFGDYAVVKGPGVVSTPIITKKGEETFYYLNLEALSIGKQQTTYFVNLTNSMTSDGGNIVIDSGTTLTYLPAYVYNWLESSLNRLIDTDPVIDPTGEFSLCYRLSDKPSIPTVTAHFTGAHIELKPTNTFVQINEDIQCLAFDITRGSFGIFGNVAQTNYLVGYDVVKKTVSFKPNACA